MSRSKVSSFPSNARVQAREKAYAELLEYLSDTEAGMFFGAGVPPTHVLVQAARAAFVLRTYAPSQDVAFLTREQSEVLLTEIAKIRETMINCATSDAERQLVDSGLGAFDGLARMWSGDGDWPRNSMYPVVLHDLALVFELTMTARAVRTRLIDHVAELSRAVSLNRPGASFPKVV